MKRLIILLMCLCYSFCNLNYLKTFAESKYARAVDATNLYKLTSTSNDLTEVICIIEKTYFVQILSDNGNSYKVNYNNQIGFVKKNDVQLVSQTPNTPFPNNIQIIVGSTCNLRSSPTTKSSTNNILTTIYAGETNLTFIGRIFADEAIDFGGTTWYYVKYGEYTGYIYNKYVKSITPIYENIEEISFYKDSPTTNINPLVHTPSLLIIIILLIPTLAIILILYLPRKHKTITINKKTLPPDNF